MLHVVVRLPDLVQRVDAGWRELQLACRDLVEIASQDRRGKVHALATIGREPHTVGDVRDGIKLFHDPLVRQHPREADSPMDASSGQGIWQGRYSDELQRGVNAIGYNLAHGWRDLASIDDSVIDTMFCERLDAIDTARRGENCRPDVLGGRGRGDAERGSPTANQQRLARLEIESVVREPYAVCNVSGIAPSVSQGRLE